jgi:hypothetical protein
MAMGTREFTDKAERQRRRDLVAAVGERVWGASWQTPLAEALAEATGRPLGRARVAQWMLAADPKPVPAWALDAVPAIARKGAARLRAAADELDALFGDEGAPPAAQGEPEADAEPTREAGPAASEAAAEGEVDMDALVALACSTPSPYAKAPEPVPERTGWRSDFADARGFRPYVPPVLASPVIPDEREFLTD